MRLAVFSDIHGNLTAFEAALADFEALGGADTIWVLGDLAAFGPRPAESVRRVQALIEQYGKDNVHVIRGNTDRYVTNGARPRPKAAEDAESFAALVSGIQAQDARFNWCLSQLSFDDYTFMRKVGRELSLEAPGYGWVIGYHGTPGDDEGYLKPDTPADEARDALLDREGRLGIGGHIHVQMDRDLGNWRAINVGSIGLSVDQPGMAQWGYFLFENGDVQISLRSVPFDVDSVIADLYACGQPGVEWVTGKLRPT